MTTVALAAEAGFRPDEGSTARSVVSRDPKPLMGTAQPAGLPENDA